MRCAVSLCSNSQRLPAHKREGTTDEDYVSFHRFPRLDDLRKKWISALKLDEDNITAKSVVCSNHFTDRDFINRSKNFRNLFPAAVPYLAEKYKIPVDPLCTDSFVETMLVDLSESLNMRSSDDPLCIDSFVETMLGENSNSSKENVKIIDNIQIVPPKIETFDSIQIVPPKIETHNSIQIVPPKFETYDNIQIVEPKIETYDNIQIVPPKIETNDNVQIVPPKIETNGVSTTIHKNQDCYLNRFSDFVIERMTEECQLNLALERIAEATQLNTISPGIALKSSAELIDEMIAFSKDQQAVKDDIQKLVKELPAIEKVHDSSCVKSSNALPATRLVLPRTNSLPTTRFSTYTSQSTQTEVDQQIILSTISDQKTIQRLKERINKKNKHIKNLNQKIRRQNKRIANLKTQIKCWITLCKESDNIIDYCPEDEL